MASPYVPLWVKTNFSFLEGASHPEEYVVAAHRLGLDTLAITDRDGVYGVVRAHVAAKEIGVRLVLGSTVTVGARRLVLHAQSRTGWANLCRLLSAGRQRCEKGRSDVTLDEVRAFAPDLIALAIDPPMLGDLREAFGDRLYALVTRHLQPEERAAERDLRDAARRLGVPTVAATEVLYHTRERRPLQDVLTCIRHGVTLATAAARIKPNAEHDLREPAAMSALFADDLGSVTRTREVADRCTFGLDAIRYRYPGERLPEGRSESDWLRELTVQGAHERYGDTIPADVHAQIDRELALIRELDYGGYFLTMHEIVRWCRERDILCQGRGSAANSAVCYCLGITAVDPVRMDLLFERFLSRERAEPPDIDLDIEHERREEVIQHVYERYDRRHAAMVANVIRYRTRSAVRDVGKALGVPETTLDHLAKMLGHWDFDLDDTRLKEAGLEPLAPAHRHLLRLSEEILAFPRHLSIHPGGFLLGHEPVDTLVPIEPATMEGRTVIQWDKQDVEDLALFKVDLLGLGMLTQIHLCLDLLRAHGGPDLGIATIPAEDPETYEMISAADTVGVFQIESRAQMAMLPRLRPRTFYDLVIEVAIVRPGPIQGDMVHPYLRRRSGQEPIDYPHPSLRRVLEKTLGVPIFQEQVMKLAILVAGYSAGEADQLRRDIAAWRSTGKIEQHRDRLIGRMVERGIPNEFAERVFSQIKGFGEYGFPESHAASFALIAYVTAWLKRHHPAAFCCSLLNAQPMGFYAVSTIIEDAKRHGVEVRPIALGASAWDSTLERAENGPLAVRMGLRWIKGFGERERARLEAAPPPYLDLADFVRRTRLPRRALVALAESGALEPFGFDRRDAIWAVRALGHAVDDDFDVSAPSSVRLAPLQAAEAIAWDYARVEHSTRGHPMSRWRQVLERSGIPDADRVRALRDGTRLDYVGMVICRQRPGTASGVTFFTLEDETGFVNLVVWRPVFDRFATIAKTARILGVTGKLQSADGTTHLIADELWVPDALCGPLAAPKSRDFH